jgi:large subunit ribosomal protein L10
MFMRAEKAAIVEEIRGQIDGASFVYVAGYHGLSVAALTELRRGLTAAHAECHVVKNAFFKKAAEALGLPGADDLLVGPTAVVAGTGDAPVAAKLLRDFAKGHETVSVRGGYLDGARLSADDFAALADIPSREVLLGRLVGSVASPMARLVGVFQQKVGSLLYVLKAAADKRAAGTGETA